MQKRLKYSDFAFSGAQELLSETSITAHILRALVTADRADAADSGSGRYEPSQTVLGRLI
jgi:hypothetical protein